MSRIKHKQKASYAGIPRVVMDCPDYTSLGGNAIRLLIGEQQKKQTIHPNALPRLKRSRRL